jgi:hypothetical protein
MWVEGLDLSFKLVGWMPEWVATADVIFMVGLSAAITCVYALENGFFWVLDTWKLLQHYKCPRKLGARLPSRLHLRHRPRPRLRFRLRLRLWFVDSPPC